MNKRHNNFSVYNKAIVIIFAVLFVLLISVTFILEQQKLLIAPQFVSSISFDEKTRFFREVKPKKSQILAVGSSITLNHLDPTSFQDKNGKQISFTNFASFGLQIGELKHLIDFAVKVIGKPSIVIISSAPVDFQSCSPPAQADGKYVSLKTFNREDAVNYILSDTPAVYYHAKYRGLWRMINPSLLLEVQRQRTTNYANDSLKFESSGSVLLEVPKEKISSTRWQGKNWAQAISQLSTKHACYDSLQELANYIEQNHMRLVFVLSPIRQGYLNEFAPSGESIKYHNNRIAAILRKSNSILIDAHSNLQLSDEYFVDAFHLNKTGAQTLTKHISENLNQYFRDYQ